MSNHHRVTTDATVENYVIPMGSDVQSEFRAIRRAGGVILRSAPIGAGTAVSVQWR